MNLRNISINATTIDDAWYQLLWNIKKHGREYTITSGSFEGHKRLEFDYVNVIIKYPNSRPLAVKIPEWSPLPPPTIEEDIEEYFANYLMDGKLSPNEHYRYSSWIVGDGKNCNYNQIEWAINHFKKYGFGTNHCTINIGNPDSNLEYDKPYKSCLICKENILYKGYEKNCPNCGNELFSNENIRGTSPCLRLLHFKILQENGENFLVLKCFMRSNDLWSGWPVNIGGFALLQEFVAQELKISVGPMIYSSAGCHIYDFQLDVLNARIFN
ncbi:MAG: Thymidylate synthase [candidate division CPR1 bacterium ADurb.Bin160]|uniref:Thymidylate synthase n=1 Tax=candidate division CPR1 bacterium ADurb.Bin160 TaxID=1852826 RepID=A0A1V5ZLR5_9BACT|nr:MAG: Thymidylate synthase [candidate division CPR1 bacterium ADurb.Bin160]